MTRLQYELRADTVSECKAWIDAIKMARWHYLITFPNVNKLNIERGRNVYLVSILPFHPFSVLTSCCSRRRSWSRNTFTFSKFDFYLDFDEIACNAQPESDLWWWWWWWWLLSTRLWKVRRQPSGNTRGTVKSLAPRSRNSERRWPSTKVILYWIDNILISAFHFEKRVASSSPATALDPVSVQWIAFDFQ